MNKVNRGVCGMMAALTIAGVIATPVQAIAQGEQGRKNTTMALGGLTGYLFTRGGNKTGAFVSAAATAVAYKRYQDSVKARHKRERIARLRHNKHVAMAKRHSKK
ncbi:MAG: hypothetical protein ABJA67_17660 [Chthonomonadales bacterium]